VAKVQIREVFGFLGPKGAGETTTIRLLAGQSQPTAGHARMLGLDRSYYLSLIKKRIGIVPKVSNLHDELTALGNLVSSTQLYCQPSDSPPFVVRCSHSRIARSRP
jgi:ABC-2 type transport system ATP-binding protein